MLTAAFSKLKALWQWVVSWIPRPTFGPKPPITLPGPGQTMQVYQAIQEYNNSRDYFTGVTSYSVPAKGVVIHVIDQTQAEAIATRIKPEAASSGMDVCFMLGCIAEESVLDPDCENGNLGPGESNDESKPGGNNPDGYDVGLCQLKLKYVMAARGIDVDAARAVALDVDQAIPYFTQLMVGHLAFAKKLIAQTAAEIQAAEDAVVAAAPGTAALTAAQAQLATATKPDVRLRNNPELLATGAYNFGEDGMEALYNLGEFPSHCQAVADLTDYFRGLLGQPKLFPGISKP